MKEGYVKRAFPAFGSAVATAVLFAALSLPMFGQNASPVTQQNVSPAPMASAPAMPKDNPSQTQNGSAATQNDATAASQAPTSSNVSPAPTASPSTSTTSAAPTAAQPPAGAPPEYVLQAGDDIEVSVYNLPELSHKLRIRPDGRISLILLDDMIAAGKTASALADEIEKGYSAHFRTPQVTVIVTSYVNQNVYVGGEVNQPRLITLNGRLSAAAAVFYAGGLKSTAKTKEIIILRNSGKNTADLIRLNLKDVLTKGSPDVELKPFDVVFVPKSRIARLDQFVDQYFKMLQPIALNLGFSYLLGGQQVQVAIP